jgi:putative Holliday junction resolvase
VSSGADADTGAAAGATGGPTRSATGSAAPNATGGRVVALDLGSVRIGVAYCDSGRTIASPWGALTRTGDATRDRAAVVAVIEEVGAKLVVVGLPLSLSGRAGPAARAALSEVAALREVLQPKGITVETADERLTTVEAQRSLTAAGRKGKAARSVIDSAAAMVLLQAWLAAAPARSGSGTLPA